MGILSQLVVEIAGDSSPLNRTLDGVRGSLSGLGGDSSLAGRSISDGLGAGIGTDLAGQIRTAMAQALRPMENLSTTMVGQFDKIGGTLVTMARRVDAHMKFTIFQATLDKIETAIPNAFGKGAVGAIRTLFKIKNVLSSIGDVAKKGLSGHGFGGVSNKVSGSYNNLMLNVSGIGPAARASHAAVNSLHGGLLRVLGLGSLVGGIGAGFTKAITGASDLNETLNKTQVIFGPGAASVQAGADQMARDFGTVRTEFMDMGATYGQILQGMGGVTKDASAVTSVQLAKLAADASSIFNKSFEDAGGAIASALRGQSEPISAFGIDTQEAAVHQEALRMGLVRGTQELTTQQKVAARSSLIIKGLRVAQGDLASTQDGFANSSRAAWGRVQNALATAGQSFMPVVESFLGGFNRMLGGVQGWLDGNKATLDSWAAQAQTAFDSAGTAVSTFGEWGKAHFERFNDEIARQSGSMTPLADAWAWLKDQAQAAWDGIGWVVRNASDLMELAGLAAMERVMNLGDVFTWLGGVAQTLGGYLANNWVGLITDAATGAWTVMSNLGENIKNLFSAIWDYVQGKGFHFDFTPLMEGFTQSVEKFPDIAGPVFRSLKDDMDVVTDRMGANAIKRANEQSAAARAAVAGTGADKPGGARPGAAPRDEEVSTSKKKNSTTDLAGFAKQLQDGLFASKNDAAGRTAKATEESRTLLKKVLEKGIPLTGGVGVVGVAV